MFKKDTLKSGWAPLVLLWLAVHVTLLAVILSLKFVTAKVVIVAMLLAAGTFFVLAQLRAVPRKRLRLAP